jgi:catalase
MQTVETTTSSPNSTNAVLNEGSFSVHSYSMIDMDDADKWVHWSKGLKMIIEKNGVTIKLEEDEITKLVKCLPRTFGGSY